MKILDKSVKSAFNEEIKEEKVSDVESFSKEEFEEKEEILVEDDIPF